MPLIKYIYSIQNDFPNHKVAPDRLATEIRASSISIAVDHIDTVGDSCEVNFKTGISPAEKTALDAIVAVHTGQELPVDVVPVIIEGPKTASGLPRVSIAKMEAGKSTTITPNWCDRTTWFQSAIRVVDENPTDQGDHKTYRLSHQNLIDNYHGKLSQEDYLKDTDGNSYRVVVKVNGNQKTEQDPHSQAGGDYIVNYTAGTITFLTALTWNDTVRVTYHYAINATFSIKPSPGTIYRLEMVEVQFSDDVVMTDTIRFQAYAGGNPVGQPLVYKTMLDLVNDSVRAYAPYPVLGGSGWRGTKRPIYVFNWDYVASTLLKSSWGMEVRVSLDHDTPMQGTFATASFYGFEEPETTEE